MTADDALLFLQTKRPMAKPNPGFMKQLKIFEDERLRDKERKLIHKA